MISNVKQPRTVLLFLTVTAVPWQIGEAADCVAVCGLDDGEGGALVVAFIVEVSCCETISSGSVKKGCL